MHVHTNIYFQIQRQRSLCSSTEEEPSLGAVNLRLQYNPDTHMLAVEIIQVTDLVPQGSNHTLNPFCKVALLPDHPSQMRTKIHERTLDPVFEEEFIFDVTPQKITSCELRVLVMDTDLCGRDECLGEVHQEMREIDFSDMAQTEIWKAITRHKEERPREVNVESLLYCVINREV